MNRRWILNLLATGLLALVAFGAAAVEQLGPTYQIKERSAYEELMAKLRAKQESGEMDRLVREGVQRSREHIEEPLTEAVPPRTRIPRTHFLDPSVTAPSTIKDPDGKVIVQAGQTVNPLSYMALSKYLVFFDGTDEKQVLKAKELMAHYNGLVKLIMVKGRPLDLSRSWKTTVYFDQGGRYVKRFGITQVPALVSQEPNALKLRIDELGV